MTALKPLFKWSGGKGDEIPKIIPFIPEFDNYVETFVGGGSLYWHLRPERAHINDLHPGAVALYKTVKAGGMSAIYDFCKEHPNEEETYYEVRKNEGTDYLSVAARFYYLRKTCFRGMLRYNKKGKFNIPFGRYKTFNFENLKNPEYERTMRNTTITQNSFEEVFKANNSENDFIFLDPPYCSPFSDYGYCQFGKEHHKKLAECFKNSSAKCLMVIGSTPFIRELYEGYIKTSYPKKYRFKLLKGRVDDKINTDHLVICNYDV